MAGGLQPPSAEEEQNKAAAKQQGVIFVLENASLETAKVGKVSCIISNQSAVVLLSVYQAFTAIV